MNHLFESRKIAGKQPGKLPKNGVNQGTQEAHGIWITDQLKIPFNRQFIRVSPRALYPLLGRSKEHWQQGQ